VFGFMLIGMLGLDRGRFGGKQSARCWIERGKMITKDVKLKKELRDLKCRFLSSPFGKS
jgi:hypothetical protein